MEKRLHEDWLTAYMDHCGHLEPPPKFHMWTGVATIAGALQRHTWIDMKTFEWVPNFYIVLVAPPGVAAKSTTISLGMDLLKEVPNVIFGPNVVTWQELATQMANSTQSFDYLHDNVQKKSSMSAMTFAASEFGNLIDPEDRNMVDLLVNLWDGRKGLFLKSTKTQGSDNILNPWINIIACTTPAWIASSFPEYMIGGGFTSRTVFIYADKKNRYIPFPDECVPEDYDERREKLIHDLCLIEKEIRGPFTINAEARQWASKWYIEHHTMKHPHWLSSNRFSGYLARKQTHICKLAMVVSASESSSQIITQPHIEKAYKMVTGAEQDMPHVFSHIGKEDGSIWRDEIIHIIREKKLIGQSELYRLVSDQIEYRQFKIYIESLHQANILQVRQGAEGTHIQYTGAQYAQQN